MMTLDAMRGAAALAVVAYHALSVAPQTATAGWEWLLPEVVGFIVHFAYAGIYMFFVISGFCIHLYWARARAAGIERPVVNFFAFWKRRVRRLYPAYLAALGLFLGYAAYKAPVAVTPFYLWDIFLHLFMVHNFDPRTIYTINGAFWTLAVEEQLYLAYFLLLFLRIRYGWARTLLICGSVRVLWLVAHRYIDQTFGIAIPLTEAAAVNWFMWALGAVSVEALVGIIKLPDWCYRISFAGLALACAAGLAMGLPLLDQQGLAHDVGWLIMHPAWAVGFFILVNRAVVAEYSWRLRSLVAPRLINALAAIGLMSYSLYLTHAFVLMQWYYFGFLGVHILTISLLITTPLSVAFAWVFFRVFERPYMSSALTMKVPAKVSYENVRKEPPEPAVEAA